MLIKNKEIITEQVQKSRKTYEKEFEKEYPNADGQVQRVITKFALIAACGELAVCFRLVSWRSLEVLKSCKKLFRSWIKARGGTISYEIIEAIKTKTF